MRSRYRLQLRDADSCAGDDSGRKLSLAVSRSSSSDILVSDTVVSENGLRRILLLTRRATTTTRMTRNAATTHAPAMMPAFNGAKEMKSSD